MCSNPTTCFGNSKITYESSEIEKISTTNRPLVSTNNASGTYYKVIKIINAFSIDAIFKRKSINRYIVCSYFYFFFFRFTFTSTFFVPRAKIAIVRWSITRLIVSLHDANNSKNIDTFKLITRTIFSRCIWEFVCFELYRSLVPTFVIVLIVTTKDNIYGRKQILLQ